MRHIRVRTFFGVAGLVFSMAYGQMALAQEPSAQAARASFEGSGAQPKSVGEVLRSVAARAGIVFVGQVQEIRPNGGVTEVVFAVQKPVVGEVGDTFTLREWSGRWTGGQQHYRVGQRSMMFLYAPNQAGLSSPVDGMAGVVPVIPMGADADPLLDVRWLATHVQRSVDEPIVDADFGAVSLADALAVVGGDNSGQLPLEPVKRPLPVGMRPRPIVTPGASTEDAQSALPSILQSRQTNDVEH